jgi:hypothetical protein
LFLYDEGVVLSLVYLLQFLSAQCAQIFLSQRTAIQDWFCLCMTTQVFFPLCICRSFYPHNMHRSPSLKEQLSQADFVFVRRRRCSFPCVSSAVFSTVQNFIQKMKPAAFPGRFE